jgi:ABC-type lipoprotein release transport system permease subunit
MPARLPLFERFVLGFSVVGTVLGVATVIFIYRTMSGFHAELMQQAHAAGDQVLLDLIARNSRIMMLILASIVLVAALNIAAGLIMLRRQPK